MGLLARLAAGVVGFGILIVLPLVLGLLLGRDGGPGVCLRE